MGAKKRSVVCVHECDECLCELLLTYECHHHHQSSNHCRRGRGRRWSCGGALVGPSRWTRRRWVYVIEIIYTYTSTYGGGGDQAAAGRQRIRRIHLSLISPSHIHTNTHTHSCYGARGHPHPNARSSNTPLPPPQTLITRRGGRGRCAWRAMGGSGWKGWWRKARCKRDTRAGIMRTIDGSGGGGWVRVLCLCCVMM